MTDLKSVDSRPGSALLYLREDELRRGIELLFFGYRDFRMAMHCFKPNVPVVMRTPCSQTIRIATMV